jgi:peptide/nickel transport system permease protein
MRYVCSLLIQRALLLCAISFVSFAVVAASPGDFTNGLLLNPQTSSGYITALRTQHTVGHSLFESYWRWIRASVRGDLGTSYSYNVSVASLLLVRARNTLLLTIPVSVLSWCGAVSAGVVCAEFAGTWFDRALTLCAAVLQIVPEVPLSLFVLGLALRSGIPFDTAGSVWADGDASIWSRARGFISGFGPPAIVLCVISTPILFTHVRIALLGVLDEPFVLSARGHGISRGRVLFRHALPASVNPLLSLLGASFGSLLSVSLVTEAIMGWPGLGPMVLEATYSRDTTVVLGGCMITGLLMVLSSLLRELLLYKLDPRIRMDE